MIWDLQASPKPYIEDMFFPSQTWKEEKNDKWKILAKIVLLFLEKLMADWSNRGS